MYGFAPTDCDKRVYNEELRDFLPESIVDVHTHVYLTGMERADDEAARKGLVDWPGRVADSLSIEDLEDSYAAMFPGKKVEPVIFGMPSLDLAKTNAYVDEVMKRRDYPALFCTSWDTPVSELYAAAERGYAGFKPYLNNTAPWIPSAETRIFDFLPPEHLRVMDELRSVVMLHIPRAGRLRDPLNIVQLMEIEEKYPNIKLIVAHIGRAYAVEDIGDAFKTLGQSERMVFDFTANTLAEAMTACLDAVGPKRLLFGSDMPITKMRMYRIVENGKYINVVPRGLYGDVSHDSHMRETDDTENITTFMYEELRAFRRAAAASGLTKADVADVMCNNARRLFE